ncbi:Mitochondrial outer membrane translocase complex, subunit Tom5 [Lasallia pustulata]|uniref:Mitochondrial outer membrane translocase complex, subunit Tom5 n=1 Tax=Lasallia pustulata TaxID=136370 RepID=A0A1W5CU25_9LECA|nr:Mitochondrial outer membrane translocase complex, subunit Tom5 [Lasallia pustulata]
MFGGPSKPPSKAELKAQEDEVYQTVQRVAIGSILLYLSPFAIDYIKRLV